MTRDQQLTSFGLFLQAARIEKEISIESLAAETRIRDEVLKRIESEDHENLPDEVFVKGFIRSYALAVGADVNEALERYRASLDLRELNTHHKAVPAARPSRFWWGLAAAVGAVLLVAGLTLYLYNRFNAPPPEPVNAKAASVAEAPQETAGEIPAPGEKAPPPVASVPPADPPPKADPPPAPTAYVLEIKAIEETWLKVVVDDQAAQEMTLLTNEVRQVEAASLINLLIGNAGGVELKLNGKPVEVAGKSGQVVNIQLP